MTPGLILVGLGLVLVLEGLVMALVPGLYDEILEFITRMPIDKRRVAGLIAIALGTVLLWLGQL